MSMRKIMMSPVVGLLITVFLFNILLPVNCHAEGIYRSIENAGTSSDNHNVSGVIVSMGDSYSAGEGIQPFYGSRMAEGWGLKDWLAHRSQSSWSGQLTLPNVGGMSFSKYPESENPHWYFVASSGAVTGDITHGQDKTYIKGDETTYETVETTVTLNPQIDIFNETRSRQIVPDYITITIGGNDLGFVDILITAAANDLYTDPCMLSVKLDMAKYKLENSYPNDNNATEDSIRDKIKEVYKQIDEAASIGDDHPCILAAGYPHLLNDNLFNTKLNGGDILNALTIFTPNDARKLNDAIDLYCKVLKEVVSECKEEGLRIEYVEVRDEFKGHEVNTAEPWINGIDFLDNVEDILNNQELELDFLLPRSGSSLHPNIYGATYGYRECFQNKINELEGLTDTPSMDPHSTESLIGSEITFGNYAGEDIVWIVLDETENGLFLLSKYAIETKDYNDKNENTTWEKSSLRKWLNGDFYESAFNSDEKKSIKLSYIQNSDNSESGADGGKDTEDRVFLLSIDETEKFFKTDEERIVSPTRHAFDNAEVVFAGDDSYVLWWLRSPGKRNRFAAYVGNGGEIKFNGLEVEGAYSGVSGVRPAMWVTKTVWASADAVSEEEQVTWLRDGNHVTFGHYEQDGDMSNGKEPIEWEVLSEEDGKLLLISLHILDSMPYDATGSDNATWETCSLRRWLNNDFMNAAFTRSESDCIMTTTLSNQNNPIGGLGGNDTDDKVFILSVDELLKYYDPEDLYEYDNGIYSPWFVREVTPYAISSGIFHTVLTDEDYLGYNTFQFYTMDCLGMDTGTWWLRSPGNFNYTACLVYAFGTTGWNSYTNTDESGRGIRPVIWLDANPSHNTSSSTGSVISIGDQNASQGLTFDDYFDDEDKYVPEGSAMVCDIGSCTDKDLVIPSVTPDGKVVAVIEDRAFEECDFLETVVVPDSVTRIMAHAFSKCENLRFVFLPNSLRQLAPRAFIGCHSLESIVIPEGVEVVRGSTFCYCYNLKSVILPNSLTEISNSAFEYCTSLESIVIPSGVTAIGSRAFKNCTSLTSITIPDGALVSADAFTDSGIQTINGIDAQAWIAQYGVDDLDD